MMDSTTMALTLAVGATVFFGFLAFAVWLDYRKKKDDSEGHRERMKALEMGHPPLEAEIERAKAYASATWAVGLIGLLVPLTLASLTFTGTIVAVLNKQPSDDISTPLIVAWAIMAVLVLVTIVACLSVIRRLPPPKGEASQRPTTPGKRMPPSPSATEEKLSVL